MPVASRKEDGSCLQHHCNRGPSKDTHIACLFYHLSSLPSPHASSSSSQPLSFSPTASNITTPLLIVRFLSCLTLALPKLNKEPPYMFPLSPKSSSCAGEIGVMGLSLLLLGVEGIISLVLKLDAEGEHFGGGNTIGGACRGPLRARAELSEDEGTWGKAKDPSNPLLERFRWLWKAGKVGGGEPERSDPK